MKRVCLFVFVVSLFLSFGLAEAAVLDVPGTWPTIQSAINAASTGDTVLVAPGMYNESIALKSNVTVKSTGGADATVIKGDGHLYWFNPSFTTTVLGATDSILEGFTITGSFYGIFNWNASPIVINNIITNNVQGICNWYSSPIISGNIISKGSYGIYNEESSAPVITNNTITGFAGPNTQGIFNGWNTIVQINNNIITGNTIGVYNGWPAKSVTIVNNDIWGNTTDIFNEGEPPFVPTMANNMSADPKFIDPASGDYRLSANSPCIDAGANGAEGVPATDLDGNPRLADGDGDGVAIVDMGAYEFKPSPATVEDVIALVSSLIDTGSINNTGTAVSLTATLESALNALARGDNTVAVNTLNAFINQVSAQAGKKISDDAAASLINAATEIISNVQ